MANEQNNSSQKVNSFSKGMIKDVVDIYTPESVWKNAVNAVNNSHLGDVGSIGNEQANIKCTEVIPTPKIPILSTDPPYVVIGIINKVKTEWVVFSTNNIGSEIGIFDDTLCTYRKIVNDPCLNFSTFNIITGAAKENYDCTYSVYWQDNLNPDRVLNLDRVPYVCTDKTVDIVTVYKEYTVARNAAQNPCGTSTTPVEGTTTAVTTPHALGESLGVVSITYDMLDIPDKLEVWFDADPAIDPPTAFTHKPNTPTIPEEVSHTGTIYFNKFTTTSTCIVRVTPFSGGTFTKWSYKINCPVPDTTTPPMPVVKSNIYYKDIHDKTQEVPALDYGASIKIVALENSIISTDSVGYTISPAGATILTKVDTVPDPNACGAQDCTDALDCDELRLHPFVKQPCITVSKSKGSGQLNNGSYQAVIAYSENGIKLTDYSMPSNAQSLWDHTGIGGSININISNLDQNFSEYELVVISIINQQTVAKKIGNYSIDQTSVHLDMYTASLVTVDLGQIPLKSVVYEKSEKMYDVSGYLLRSSVTTQPFFNYQPLANQIKAEWIAVEYPADYYWQGGNQVGNMRDEVYSYFIRWVYKTGARSASFHIPGREALNTDTELIPASDNNIIDPDKREKWRTYDTSTISMISDDLFTADKGKLYARGEMAYWESVEKYPNNHKEIWGDLCFKPIRHHKMPSNETIHIHSLDSTKIYVLGVDFYNIKHPVDNDNKPITDIVGYEILRGSREGNRSILAKGLFNNMVEYKIRGNNEVTGLFQNYPYNDIDKEDPFLLSSNELNVSQKILSFHAPENSLVKPYVGTGAYIKIYTEEIGKASIVGQVPYKHPKFKFMNEATFIVAGVISAGVALLSLFGKSTSTTSTAFSAGDVIPIAAVTTASTTVSRESGTATVYTDIVTNGVSTVSAALDVEGAGVLLAIGTTLATIVDFVSSAVEAALSFYLAFDATLELIYHLLKHRSYVIQLNSHGFYNSFKGIDPANAIAGVKPSYTRYITNTKLKYINAGLQDFDGSHRIINTDRTRFLALQLDKDLPFTTTKDNSKSLLPDTGAKESFDQFDRDIASYYGSIKFDYENQYGQLQGIVQIPTSSCVYEATLLSGIYQTPVIFGGDVYINRYTEKNPFYFFHTWLFDVPDSTEFDYRDYEVGPEPTYWLDSRRYDASLFGLKLSLSGLVPKFDVTSPKDFYNLHHANNGTTHDSTCGLGICRSWMYLSNNSVRDFFTESELNIAFRDYGEDSWQKFYDPVGNSFSDLSTMFRSDLIKEPIYYAYDLSLSASKLYSNFKSWSNILPRDYDPLIYRTCFQYYPKRIVYSLQQQSGFKRDNWRNFLQFNYKDWNGKVNSIKTLNAQGALILFEDLEPVQFVGVDTMESAAGVKFTLGDAGLFMQNMQSLVNADDAYAYGTSISHRGTVNTPYGMFWISQKTGKILAFNGSGIDEISNQGMKHWFLENLPSPLLAVYPTFPLYDNIIEGIACQAIFDSQYELLYFTKKDYKPLPSFDAIKDKLIYINGEGFYIDNGETTTTPPGTPIISCPDGYTYEASSNTCVRTVTTPICPAGYTYDPTGVGSCVGPAGATKSCKANIVLFGTNNFGLAASNILPYKNFYADLINGFAAAGKLSAADGGDGSVKIGIGYFGNCGNILTNLTSDKTLLLSTLNAFGTGFNGGNNILGGLDTGAGMLLNVAEDPTAKRYAIISTHTCRTVSSTLTCPPIFSSEPQPTAMIPLSLGQYLLDYAQMIKSNFKIKIIETLITGLNACDRELCLEYTANMYNNPTVCTGFAASWIPPVGFSSNPVPSPGGGINGLELYESTSANATIVLNNILAELNCTVPPIPVPTIPCVSPCIKDSAGAGTCSCIERVSPIVETRPGQLIKKLTKIDIKDYLEEYNWTVSYDPKIKAWISFHDWHPSFMIPSYNHFITIKGKSFWRHNTVVDNYCEYYDTTYPWEVEYPIMTPSEITTLRSIEYIMQGQIYYNDGKDFNHVLDVNFDRAIVYNSEQISGLLNLNLKDKKNPVNMLQYPKINGTGSIDILYSKEENKFRFNQFYDITDDRGEFVNSSGVLDTTPMWITGLDGHTKAINGAYIDYTKKPLEHKKFRHYGNFIVLRKNVSGNVKMILKLTYSKHLNSPR